MVHYRHRFYFGAEPALITLLFVTFEGLILWDLAFSPFRTIWWGALILPTIGAWYWLIVIRGLNRTVVIDDEGLWIDGRWQVAGPDIAAVGVLGSDPIAHNLTRVDDTPYPIGKFHMGAGAWSQSSWGRLVQVEGVGRAVVTRERDLARGGGLPGLLVVSRRSDDGHLRGLRKAWIIGTYRHEDFARAIWAIAPDAALQQPHEAFDVLPEERAA